jgi:hypothetical protein
VIKTQSEMIIGKNEKVCNYNKRYKFKIEAEIVKIRKGQNQ